MLLKSEILLQMYKGDDIYMMDEWVATTSGWWVAASKTTDYSVVNLLIIWYMPSYGSVVVGLGLLCMQTLEKAWVDKRRAHANRKDFYDVDR